MGWLLHKFAQATQTGAFVFASILGTGVLGGAGIYDAFTEDQDNITGVNRDKVVEIFERKIDNIETLKASYDEILAERDMAGLYGNEILEKDLLAQAELKDVRINAMANNIKQELPLMTSISEQDYADLGSQFNDVFAFKAHNINVDAAAYLHDAQAKIDPAYTDRNVASTKVQDTMLDLESREVGGTELASLVLKGGNILMALSLIPIIILSNLSVLENIAKQPTPKSPLSKISEGIKKNRQRKTQKKRQIN